MNNICLHTIKSIIILKICTFNICSRRNLAGGFGENIQPLPPSFEVNHKALFGVLLRTNTRENAENVLYTFYNIFLCSQFWTRKNGVVSMSVTNDIFADSYFYILILDIFKNVQNGKVRSSVNNNFLQYSIFSEKSEL